MENPELIEALLLLKQKNDVFEKERSEIRADFLLRGICANEVDGLLEDPGLYSTWVPEHLRWDAVRSTYSRGIIESIEKNGPA